MTETRWATKIEYYSKETGEQLTAKEAKRNYIILKTLKHVEETVEVAKYTGYRYILKTNVIRAICTTAGSQRRLFDD